VTLGDGGRAPASRPPHMVTTLALVMARTAVGPCNGRRYDGATVNAAPGSRAMPMRCAMGVQRCSQRAVTRYRTPADCMAIRVTRLSLTRVMKRITTNNGLAALAKTSPPRTADRVFTCSSSIDSRQRCVGSAARTLENVNPRLVPPPPSTLKDQLRDSSYYHQVVSTSTGTTNEFSSE